MILGKAEWNYMKNRENERMILESVENGPLIWPTVEENGVTRTKKYVELSAAEKIQADCDMKATISFFKFPPSQYGSIHPTKHYSSTYPSQPQFNHSSLQPSYPYQSQMNHQTSSAPKIAYQSPQVSTQPMTESPLVNSCLVVPVFSLGNGFSDRCSFLKTEDLDTYDSDCDDISNAKAVLMANISSYGSDIISEVFKDQFDSIKKTRVRTKEQSDSLTDKLNLKSTENKDLKAQIQGKVFVITSLKNDLRKLKGKEIIDIASQTPSANTIVPGMFKLDLDPLAPKLLQNKEAHIDYLKYTQQHADIFWGIVKQAKAKQPLDNALDFASNVVPPKKTTSYSVETQKPKLKVYSRKPKNVKNAGLSKKAKIVESKNANHSEPNHTWGSNIIDIPSSSSLVMTGCLDYSLDTVRFKNDHIARIMGYGDYQLNGVVERRNRTLVEAARTMLIFSKAPLFLWPKQSTQPVTPKNVH
nr:putative ribonuclease H-like domain-containing protein [Tanacetum cinerariifolium]